MIKPFLFFASALMFATGPALAAEPTGANLAKLNAVWWYHLSEEAQANAHSVYRAASAQLDTLVRKPGTATLAAEVPAGVKTTANAVVLDIDETVLNNSAFNAWLMRENRDYSEASWQDWVAKAEAKPLPGALEFVRKARSLGVQVYYVTNRECVAKDGEACPAKRHTMRNLVELGFPDVKPEYFLLKHEQPGWVSDKSSRRTLLASQGKRIIMLLGDDLKDFMPSAEVDALRAGKPSDEAKQAIQSQFGTRWFMLPNPMYGSWDRAMPANLAARAARLNPPSGWDAPATAKGLKLASWNIAWLANAPLDEPMAQRCEEEARTFRNFDDRPTALCRNGGPFRHAADYQRLARHAKLVDADILAFEEVEGLDAIQRVVDGKGLLGSDSETIAPGTYVTAAFPGGGWQKVGLAIRKSILAPNTSPTFKPFAEIGEPLDRDQRGALEANLTLADGSKLTVLAVHLKSRCASGSLSAPTDHCRMLVKQAPILSRWIAAKEKAGERYVILGDFNRELASERAGDADTLTRWIENGDGTLNQAPIIAPTAAFKHPAGCYNPRYPGNSIDHIVLGGGAERGWVAGSVEAVPYRDPQTGAALIDHAKVRDLYSDHCVITTRWQP